MMIAVCFCIRASIAFIDQPEVIEKILIQSLQIEKHRFVREPLVAWGWDTTHVPKGGTKRCRHRLPRWSGTKAIGITFTDKPVTAFGGLALFVAFAQRIRLATKLAEVLPRSS
jgi:hypothetical protein